MSTKKALVVVDVQNDFMPDGALPAQDGYEVVTPINDLMDQFRRNGDIVVATQDWHPENHGSFAVNNDGMEPFEMGELNGMDQVMWPEHCVQGSEGAEFVDALNSEDFQTIFRKGMNPKVDSYSAFMDNGEQVESPEDGDHYFRHHTGLDAFLSGLDVEEVFVVGVATDYCVKWTAMDSVDMGYETTVVTDCCRGVDPEDVQDALNEMNNHGVEIITSDQIE
jgi:nicotinamidase/pyrazinamidase